MAPPYALIYAVTKGKGESSVSANRFDFISAGASLIGLATSFPLFYADEKGWNSVGSFGMWTSAAVNTVVSCLGTCSDGKWFKIGISIFSSLIGGAYTFFSIWNWVSKGIDFWLPFASDISLMLQGICRFLLLFKESMIFFVEIAFDFSCSAFGFMQARWEISDNEEWASDWRGVPFPVLEV